MVVSHGGQGGSCMVREHGWWAFLRWANIPTKEGPGFKCSHKGGGNYGRGRREGKATCYSPDDRRGASTATPEKTHICPRGPNVGTSNCVLCWRDIGRKMNYNRVD